MSYVCYIIFSKTLNHYYIGYTSDLETRLKLHNDGSFGGKAYTSKIADWEIYLIITCESINQAIYVESKIKKMKSRKFIEDLKKYPQLVDKIFFEFNKEPSTENPCDPVPIAIGTIPGGTTQRGLMINILGLFFYCYDD